MYARSQNILLRQESDGHNKMKRVLNWLKSRFSRRSVIAETEELRVPVGVEVTPKEDTQEEYIVEIGFDAEVPGRIESREPGRNVLISGKYADAEAVTVPDLKILDEKELGASRELGFDPYDTGCFDTSETLGPVHKSNGVTK